MKVIRIGGMYVRVHSALLIMLALGILAGDVLWIGILAFSLTAHELSHALAARILKIRVVELELMPFGAAARLENAWSLRAGQLIVVALAGPMANLLLMALSIALDCLVFPPLPIWDTMRRVNVALLLFNMLPALPLDGGRILSGLLSLRIGQERAANVGVWIGRVLAMLLLAAALLGAFLFGIVNLSLILSALFILSCAGRERIAAGSGALISLIDRQGELAGEGALPVRWLASGDTTTLRALIAQFSPRMLHRIAIYDERMILRGVLEESDLLKAALDDSGQPVGNLLKPAQQQKKNASA